MENVWGGVSLKRRRVQQRFLEHLSTAYQSSQRALTWRRIWQSKIATRKTSVSDSSKITKVRPHLICSTSWASRHGPFSVTILEQKFQISTINPETARTPSIHFQQVRPDSKLRPPSLFHKQKKMPLRRRPHPQSQHIKANEGYLCQRFMLISLLRMEQLSHHGLTGKNQAKRRDSCTKRTLENPIPSLSVTVLYSPTLHRKTIGRGTAHIIWHCRGRVQPCGKSYWPPPVLPSEVNLITKKSNTFLLEFTSTNCAKLLVSISLLCWAAQ